MTVTALSDSERAAAAKLASRHNDRVAEAQPLLDEVADIFRITLDDLRTGTSIKHVDARTVIAAALVTRGWSYDQIGEAVNRNRSTVYHLIQRAEVIPELRSLCRELVQARGS